MSSILTFEESAVRFVLDSFEKDVDDQGYVIDIDTGNRVTTLDGEEIKVEHLAGIENGSEIFISDDFVSLVEHVERRRNK